VWVADNNELIENFSSSKSGWPCSSVYFLRDCPNFPVSCSINFFGSVSSLASTPASNGSSSNGFSFELGVSLSNEISAGSAGSAGSVVAAGSGVEPATFNLYFVSSVRLFFLTLQLGYW
jgi:hypothetical protein